MLVGVDVFERCMPYGEAAEGHHATQRQGSHYVAGEGSGML